MWCVRVPPTAYWVYDLYVPVLSVALPLPLLNMAQERHLSRGRAGRRRPSGCCARPRTTCPRLPSGRQTASSAWGRAPGRQLVFYDYLWTSPADFLADGDIDITAQRRQRHQALRRRMNQAKERVASRSAPRSAKATKRCARCLRATPAPWVI